MNRTEELLVDLNIIDKNQVELFFPKVRDSENVQVMRCKKSGVVYLSSSDHLDESHYKNWKAPQGRQDALKETYLDDSRRFNMFLDLVKGRKYLDVGTQLGGILELFKGHAAVAHGVELQDDVRALANEAGLTVFGNISEVPKGTSYEVVSLFHVFEHLFSPMDVLANVKEVMSEGATLIIEVPHARDFLFNQLDLPSFKDFTFWSEHLILHTRESLKTILEAAGFKNVEVKGFQRYPLANHLYWLRHGLPAGQKVWGNLSNDEINEAYSNLLESIDQNDTIIATATK